MNPIHQVRDWAKDIVDLALIAIAFGVVVYIIFGPESGWYFSTITKNLIGFINEKYDSLRLSCFQPSPPATNPCCLILSKFLL